MNANAQPNTILFPPGRIVQGDLYRGQDKDMQGNPRLIKTGPNAGKPTINFYFAVAIAKTRANWWEEIQILADGSQNPWGPRILAIANAGWPQGQTQNPKFAWKIEDGDSQIPNEKGRKNCDREGHSGCWILKFGSSFPPKIFDEQGSPLLEVDLVKPGFWVEVLGSVQSNENTSKPGIYLNHNMIAFRGRDKEIISGPDPRAVGFGKAALPAHVTMAPTGTANLPPMPGAPALPPAPGGYVPPAATPALPPAPGYVPPAAATPPAAIPVMPHAPFIAPPVPGALPSVPAAPAAPPAAPAAYPDPLGAPAGHRMANAAGPRYDSFRSQGWTDAQLLAGGHMVRL